MPCTKCANGKYKWGSSGECKYDSKGACESSNQGKAMRDFSIMYPRIAGMVFNQPLAIDSVKLTQIINVLDQYDPNVIHSSFLAKIGDDLGFVDGNENEDDEDEEELLFQRVGSSAIIHISGTLVHRYSWVNAPSGLVSYESISAAFQSALASDAEKIILNIESPGGVVTGLFDLVDQIYNARNIKPIIGFAEQATSAAYAILSATNRSYVSQSGMTGSIGVILAHRDISKAEEKIGVKTTEIIAGKHKADGSPHKPLDEQGKATLQGLVDKFHTMFVDVVARNLNVSTQLIKGTEAAVYIGVDAIPHNLVDGVTTLPQLLEVEVKEKGSNSILLQNHSSTSGPSDANWQLKSKTLGDINMAINKIEPTESIDAKIDPKVISLEKTPSSDADRLAKLEAAFDKQTQELAAANANSVKLQRDVRLKDTLTLVKDKYACVPAEHSIVAELLLWAEETDGEMHAKLTDVFDKSNAIIEKSILLETSGVRGKTDEEFTPTSKNKVEAIFTSYMAAVRDVQKEQNMSQLEAMRYVAQTQPELYTKYAQAHRAQSSVQIDDDLDS